MTEPTSDDVWTRAQTSIVRDLLLRTVKAETTVEVLRDRLAKAEAKLAAVEKLADEYELTELPADYGAVVAVEIRAAGEIRRALGKP